VWEIECTLCFFIWQLPPSPSSKLCHSQEISKVRGYIMILSGREIVARQLVQNLQHATQQQ
jgi:hypothetical protein